MNKDKPKNDLPRLSSLVFVLLWMSGHIGVWLVTIFLMMFLPRMGIYFEALPLMMTLALGTGVFTALWQKFIVQRGLKKSMDGWLKYSTAGWALSGLATFLLIFGLMIPRFDDLPDPVLRLMLVPLFVPVAVEQWFWLRSRVKHAWLWVAAALAGATLFTLPIMSPLYRNLQTAMPGLSDLLPFLVIGLSALFYSGATGFIMRYLWTNEREKPKHELVAEAESSADDAARLERLHDASTEPVLSSNEPEVLKAAR
jgi:hypothetical protein